ncbi:MAG: cytochrome d ubiquinol oxidase subunit II [Phycisphaerae bacterium]
MEHAFLAHVWALLLALMLAMYVILDGFDLGIGVLSLFVSRSDYRRQMMASIGAVWDANETWLVLAGGTLFGAFPAAYAVACNALYIPIMVMLFGLVFRAVSLEFRAHSRHKRAWEAAFGLGSLLAVAGQGFTLGGVLSEINVGAGGEFAGGPWDWLTPLSALTFVAVGFGYVMIGGAYLIAKADGLMRRHVRTMVLVFAVVMFAAVAAVTILLPILHDIFARRWIKDPARGFLYAFGVGAAFALVMILLSTRLARSRYLPFASCIVFFLLALAGGLTAAYPYILPPSLRIVETASGTPTLIFMLVGIGPLIPLMLLYNLYLYRVFRGQAAQADEEYQ